MPTPVLVTLIVGLLAFTVSLVTFLYNVSRNRVVLVISQSGGDITNWVMNTSDGAVGYMLDLKIINDSLRPVTLRGFELTLLWNDPDFRWLYDPADASPRDMKYKMPGTFLEYSRDMVINHRTFTEGMMQPGAMMEGLLLGRGLTPIPSCFPHGSEIEMTLTVYTQRGKPHKVPFTFFVWADRPQIDRQ